MLQSQISKDTYHGDTGIMNAERRNENRVGRLTSSDKPVHFCLYQVYLSIRKGSSRRVFP